MNIKEDFRYGHFHLLGLAPDSPIKLPWCQSLIIRALTLSINTVWLVPQFAHEHDQVLHVIWKFHEVPGVGRKLFLYQGYTIVLYFLLYLGQGNPGLAYVSFSVYITHHHEKQPLSLRLNSTYSETEQTIDSEVVH